MSVWKDIHQRSNGESQRKEDINMEYIQKMKSIIHAEFSEYQNYTSIVTSLSNQCISYGGKGTDLNLGQITDEEVEEVLDTCHRELINGLHLKLYTELPILKQVKEVLENRVYAYQILKWQQHQEEMEELERKNKRKKTWMNVLGVATFIVVWLVIPVIVFGCCKVLNVDMESCAFYALISLMPSFLLAVWVASLMDYII